jgi:hypothetical protein
MADETGYGYAISLNVGQCSDGYCVIMVITDEGRETHSIQGGARYPTAEEARADGLQLLKLLRKIMITPQVSVSSKVN